MINKVFRLPFELKLWVIYLIIFPLYFMPSGEPQIADYLMVLLMLMMVLGSRIQITRSLHSLIRPLILLGIYVAIVNLFTFISTLDAFAKGANPLYYTLFFFYNIGVVILAYILYSRHKKSFLWATALGLFLGALLVIVISPFFTNAYYSTIRLTLTFNNPNQTGYYGLSALTFFIITSRAIKIHWIWSLLMSVMCIYITAASLSQAAIISILLLYGLNLLEGITTNFRRIFGLVALIAVAIFYFTYSDFGNRIIDNYNYRRSVYQGSDVGEIQYRGYDRIINHPHYVILGAGEGYYNRFITYSDSHEIHSTLGTLIFCYGIPGTFLFSLFVFRSIIKVRWNVAIYLLPLLAYGLTHMGLRFTFFWLSIAILGILSAQNRLERSNSKQITALQA